MGGSDPSEINIKVLKVLKKFPNMEVNLVTTQSNRNLNKLKEFVNKHKKNVNLYINSSKIASLMNKSDFAIVTPSVTLNEVYFMELPFIAIKTAENQKELYKFLKKKEFLCMKKFKKKKLKKLIDKLINQN